MNKQALVFGVAALLSACLPKPLPLEEGNIKWGVEITWHGHSCFTLKDSLDRTLVIDPFDETVGYGRLHLAADAVLITHHHFDHDNVRAVATLHRNLELVDSTGTTTVASGLNVLGINSFHDAERGALNGPNKIYRFNMAGLNIVHLGDFGQKEFTRAQLDAMGKVDVLFIPVGGFTTIDAAQAKNIVDQLKPGAVFPMHYGDIRFYKLAPVAAFLTFFEENQRKTLDDSHVRVRLSDLSKTPTVYTLTTTNRN